MILFPAIDIKNKRCVRLTQGDFNQETMYEEDPVSVAKRFQDAGAKALHVVDLDGASDGVRSNADILKAMREAISIPIELGGGIRDEATVDALINLGIDHVIIGTMAVNNQPLLQKLIDTYGPKIVVSIDTKDGFVTTHGWVETTSIKLLDFCQSLIAMGVKRIIFTDIAKDGMLSGPNFDLLKRLTQEVNLEVIASGGVTSCEDLKKLHAMGLFGAIIGKAIYEEKITIKEALSCSQSA